MLARLLAQLRQQWMGALALFLVLTGGTAYAANTVLSSDIVDGEVKSVDIGTSQIRSGDVRNDNLSAGGLSSTDLAPGSVGPSEVTDGTLNDEDVAERVFNFTGDIGTVPAHACVERLVIGVNAQGDHLLLTPNYETQASNIVYSADYESTGESMIIQACNNTGSAINDGTTQFNLLVIDGGQ
jgi:hypothetical protein